MYTVLVIKPSFSYGSKTVFFYIYSLPTHANMLNMIRFMKMLYAKEHFLKIKVLIQTGRSNVNAIQQKYR